MFCVPHVLLEDGEPITIAALRTNKRKVALQQIRRNAPRAVTYANDEQERARRRRRRPKSAVKNEEIKKKKKRGNPSRSSFYTIVHSPDMVEKFLESCRFRRNANPTENYSVDICTGDGGVEFYVRLDKELNFIEMKFPNLRWCMTDVKRTWQPRPKGDVIRGGLVREEVRRNRHGSYQRYGDVMSPDHDVTSAPDDVILDGCETDVRFLLQSRYALQPHEIRDSKYARYQHVLVPSNQERSRPFAVQEDLWKDVRLIRFIETTTFTPDTAPQGFSGLTVYLAEVTEYSRPAQSVNEFQRVTTRWEVSLEAALPKDLTEKESLKKFLQEIWEFSLSLSSYISHKATNP